MKRFTILLSVILFLFSFVPQSHAKWKFDRMISDIEKRVPMLEKQSEILIKMLSSDKHLAKIKEDIKKSLQASSNSKVPPLKTAYVYRVFKKLKMPFEKTAIEKKLLFDRHKRGMSYSLHNPGVLTYLIAGGGRRRDKNPISVNMGFLTEEKAQRLVNLCEKIMAIQKPVQMLMREKLPSDELIKWTGSKWSGDYISRSGSTYHEFRNKDVYGMTQRHSRSLYNIFVPDLRVGGTTALVWKKKNLQKYREEYHDEVYSKFPLAYWEVIRKLISYYQEIGYGGANWDEDYFDPIDKILTKIAEDKEGFGDLMGGGEEEKPAAGMDEGLGLDDLKLPE